MIRMGIYRTFIVTVLAVLVMNSLFCYLVMNTYFHCRRVDPGGDKTTMSVAETLEMWPVMHFNDNIGRKRIFIGSNEMKTADFGRTQSNSLLGSGFDLNSINMKTINEETSNLIHQASLLENDRILSPPSCDNDIYLLVIVVSAPGHFKRRAEMRDAIKVMSYRGKRFRFVFVTARPDNPNTDAILRVESFIYKDIIQANHIDAYRKLTYTALESLKWALTECGHAKFLLKIDDDVLVIIEHIIDYTIGLESSNATLVYAGLHNENPSPSRNVFSKWYLSREEYKNDTIPPFVCGFAVLFSYDAVREIYRASFHVSRTYHIPRQTFPLDDAFIGICAKFVNIKLTKVLWMCYDWSYVEEAVRKDRCVMVKLRAVHGVTGYKEIEVYLNQLKNMTLYEKAVCQKKNIKLPMNCFE